MTQRLLARFLCTDLDILQCHHHLCAAVQQQLPHGDQCSGFNPSIHHLMLGPVASSSCFCVTIGCNPFWVYCLFHVKAAPESQSALRFVTPTLCSHLCFRVSAEMYKGKVTLLLVIRFFLLTYDATCISVHTGSFCSQCTFVSSMKCPSVLHLLILSKMINSFHIF